MSHPRGEISSARRCMRRVCASASSRLLGLSVSFVVSLSAYQRKRSRNYGLDPLTDMVLTDAFIRDESSKGRYDPGLTKICFEMLLELFNRTLRSDLGPRAGGEQEIEDVC